LAVSEARTLKHPDAGDIPTPRGGTWAPMQVKNILDRASG